MTAERALRRWETPRWATSAEKHDSTAAEPGVTYSRVTEAEMQGAYVTAANPDGQMIVEFTQDTTGSDQQIMLWLRPVGDEPAELALTEGGARALLAELLAVFGERPGRQRPTAPRSAEYLSWAVIHGG